MSDDVDRAQALHDEWLGDALRDQQRRSGLAGKTVADSATSCEDCGAPIPQARRQLLPGVQRCVDCQEFEERLRK